MVKYLIDTNICIYIMNQRPPGIIRKFRQFELGDIGVSTITVSELAYGAAKNKKQKQNRQRVEAFLAPLEVVAYDGAAADAYGTIRLQLEKSGKTIGPLDMLIAAHALSRDCVLVTKNEKEFRRVKGLKTENWAK